MYNNNDNATTTTHLYYRRVDDDDDGNSGAGNTGSTTSTTEKGRGRHLIATQDLQVGQLIFVERPIFAFQSLANIQYNRYICYGCKAFCCQTTLETLQWRQWRCNRSRQNTENTNDNDDGADDTMEDTSDAPNPSSLSPSLSLSPSYVECRNRCGYVFCNNDICEAQTWELHHQYLCTGLVTEQEQAQHPIVQYKQYAIETNEIFICIAEWYLAQHHSTRIKLQQQQEHEQSEKERQYTDYMMNPWWEVVTEQMIQDTSQPIAGYVENGTTPITIHKQLYEICHHATQLFNTLLGYTITPTTTTTTNMTLLDHGIPPMTTYDMACRIGAMEQNAMGIRQRSLFCTPNSIRSLFDKMIQHQEREQHQSNTYNDCIVQCLQETGFLPSDDDDDDEDGSADNDDTMKDSNLMTATKQQQMTGSLSYTYTYNDIAVAFSKMYMNEDFSVQDDDTATTTAMMDDNTTSLVIQPTKEILYNCITDGGDDLDILFPPLDGTAMYSTACKMNHSCEPNVILMYRRRLLSHMNSPLTAYIVALRDIKANEELTISYINANQPFDQRQKDLQHYGFVCQCTKCVREKDQMEDDIGDNETDEEDSKSVTNGDSNTATGTNNNIADGATILYQKLERLDTLANHSMFGHIPSNCYNPVMNYIVQTCSLLMQRHQEGTFEFDDGNRPTIDKTIIDLLNSCMTGIQNRDYSLCKIVGEDLKSILIRYNCDTANAFTKYNDSNNNNNIIWLSVAHREAYFCSIIVSCVGYCHDYDFIAAKYAMDHTLVHGMPRECIEDFVQYIEYFAQQMVSSGPYPYVPSRNICSD